MNTKEAIKKRLRRNLFSATSPTVGLRKYTETNQQKPATRTPKRVSAKLGLEAYVRSTNG